MGIPVVQITAIPNVAQMLSVSRIVVGKAVPHPTGDAKLDKEKEKALRKKFVLKALELLTKDVSEPTIAEVES